MAHSPASSAGPAASSLASPAGSAWEPASWRAAGSADGVDPDLLEPLRESRRRAFLIRLRRGDQHPDRGLVQALDAGDQIGEQQREAGGLVVEPPHVDAPFLVGQLEQRPPVRLIGIEDDHAALEPHGLAQGAAAGRRAASHPLLPAVASASGRRRARRKQPSGGFRAAASRDR
jgi:hypothetical protein